MTFQLIELTLRWAMLDLLLKKHLIRIEHYVPTLDKARLKGTYLLRIQFAPPQLIWGVGESRSTSRR